MVLRVPSLLGSSFCRAWRSREHYLPRYDRYDFYFWARHSIAGWLFDISRTCTASRTSNRKCSLSITNLLQFRSFAHSPHFHDFIAFVFRGAGHALPSTSSDGCRFTKLGVYAHNTKHRTNNYQDTMKQNTSQPNMRRTCPLYPETHAPRLPSYICHHKFYYCGGRRS